MNVQPEPFTGPGLLAPMTPSMSIDGALQQQHMMHMNGNMNNGMNNGMMSPGMNNMANGSYTTYVRGPRSSTLLVPGQGYTTYVRG